MEDKAKAIIQNVIDEKIAIDTEDSILLAEDIFNSLSEANLLNPSLR